MKTDKKDCYEIVTERIVSLLESGEIPWKKPWKTCGGFPKNLISKKEYRGINVLLLHSMRYESPFWLTFKQTLDLGGNVRKGEKGCPVVFWKMFEKSNLETGKTDKIPMMRFYYVFNVAQCENLDPSKIPALPVGDAVTDADDYTAAESIILNMPLAPAIQLGKDRAYYSPAGDYVGMPNVERFASKGHYFATLFHELGHSTGHASRLARKQEDVRHNYGDENYSKEELCAEMTSAFLCGVAGISETHGLIDNSAAYIANWLHALRNDKKLVVQAAGLAQKAADYILNIKHETPLPVA